MKVWTAEDIKKVIETNDDQVGKMLVKLYNCQTDAEKNGKSTAEANGRGFNKFDAPMLSSLAESYKQYGRLTPKQLELARKRIKKYAGQLAMIANGK